MPAASAIAAAPTWWLAKIHPKTTGARAPKCARARAIVGGIVATQSSP